MRIRTQYSSISRKLTRINMLVSGCVLLLACVSFFFYDLYTYKQGVTRNLSVQAQVIASNAASALVFNDEQSAQTTLLALKASPRILYAGIYTLDGQLFAEYRRDKNVHSPALRRMPPDQAQLHWFEQGQIALVDSIFLDGKPIGFVSIRSDMQAVVDRLKG